jgi:hypothetical protein
LCWSLWLPVRSGGGYVFGDAHEFTLYDGTNLAINENVIVVAGTLG